MYQSLVKILININRNRSIFLVSIFYINIASKKNMYLEEEKNMSVSTMDILIDLQRNYETTYECSKIIKDGSYIYLLKKLKSEFNLNKEKFVGKNKALEAIREDYKKKGIEITLLKKQLEEFEDKLYNHSGSDLKLIEGLQKKVEDTKELMRELENYSIELIEKDEKISEEKEIIRLELVNLKENFESFKEMSNKKISKAKDELDKANHNIERLRNTVPKEVLIKFDEVKLRKTTAVAELQGEVCTGCKVKVSAVTKDSINRGDRIVYCDNCGRILCYNDIGKLKEAR